MKKELESSISRKVAAYCKRRGLYCRKLEARGINGFPDRMICGGGKVLFLELKAVGQKPTALQEREIRLLRQAGMRAEYGAGYYEAIVEIQRIWPAEDVIG